MALGRILCTSSCFHLLVSCRFESIEGSAASLLWISVMIPVSTLRALVACNVPGMSLAWYRIP